MEDRWLTQLKRLRALASTGLEFTKSDYERERYQDMLDVILAMLSDLGEVPLERVADVLLPHVNGYETPKVDVRAAVIQDNKILLVQEKTDKRWSLPGGYADVGLSAAENAIKEVEEEAGIKVVTKKIYAVRHKAKGAYPPDVRDFYKIFFLCEQVCSKNIAAGSEALDAGYFSMDKLPELSSGRVIEEDLAAAFNCLSGEMILPFFD